MTSAFLRCRGIADTTAEAAKSEVKKAVEKCIVVSYNSRREETRKWSDVKEWLGEHSCLEEKVNAQERMRREKWVAVEVHGAFYGPAGLRSTRPHRNWSPRNAINRPRRRGLGAYTAGYQGFTHHARGYGTSKSRYQVLQGPHVAGRVVNRPCFARGPGRYV